MGNLSIKSAKLIRNAEASADKKTFGRKGVDEGIATKAYLISRGGNVPNLQKKYPITPGKPNRSYPAFKKGGMVKKTELAKVHKGERVLTVNQAKRYSRMKSK